MAEWSAIVWIVVNAFEQHCIIQYFVISLILYFTRENNFIIGNYNVSLIKTDLQYNMVTCYFYLFSILMSYSKTNLKINHTDLLKQDLKCCELSICLDHSVIFSWMHAVIYCSGYCDKALFTFTNFSQCTSLKPLYFSWTCDCYSRTATLLCSTFLTYVHP